MALSWVSRLRFITSLERLARDKRSSLLQIFINNGHKTVFNIDTRSQCYETIFVRNLQNFVISYCSYMTDLFNLVSYLSVRPGADPKVSNWMVFINSGRLQPYPKHTTKPENLDSDTHSSLLRTFKNFVHKTVYNIDTRAQCYKTIFSIIYKISEKARVYDRPL